MRQGRLIIFSIFCQIKQLEMKHLSMEAKTFCTKGGIPGLVVMGVDSCSRSRGIESRHHLLDGIDNFHIDLC